MELSGDGSDGGAAASDCGSVSAEEERSVDMGGESRPWGRVAGPGVAARGVGSSPVPDLGSPVGGSRGVGCSSVPSGCGSDSDDEVRSVDMGGELRPSVRAAGSVVGSLGAGGSSVPPGCGSNSEEEVQCIDLGGVSRPRVRGAGPVDGFRGGVRPSSCLADSGGWSSTSPAMWCDDDGWTMEQANCSGGGAPPGGGERLGGPVVTMTSPELAGWSPGAAVRGVNHAPGKAICASARPHGVRWNASSTPAPPDRSIWILPCMEQVPPDRQLVVEDRRRVADALVRTDGFGEGDASPRLDL